jgi:energy-coupling factor transporter transmembrane protein EcfT
MEDKTFKEQLKDTKEEVQTFMEAQIALWKLDTAQALSRLLTIIVTTLLVGGFAFLGLLFFSVLLVFLVAKMVDSYIIALVIIIVMNALLGLLIFSMRKKLFREPYLQKVLRILFPDPEKKSKE